MEVDAPCTLPSMRFNCREPAPTWEDHRVTFSPMHQRRRRILHTAAVKNKRRGYVRWVNEHVRHLLYAFACGRYEADSGQLGSKVFFCSKAMLAYYLGGDFFCVINHIKDTGTRGTIHDFERCFSVSGAKALVSFGGQPNAVRVLRLLLGHVSFHAGSLTCRRYLDFFFFYPTEPRGAVLFAVVTMLRRLRDMLLLLNNL
ncbi:putative GTPase activating protein of Rab-like GTPase [Trypanosoma rangeli]|uniref:Putative GTPase activating protein of Rab-like GTPase n=1 Tax=Trypanosoma rangeli TaxID=5698 RepID=A0A422N2Y9_TRYRA|nr:putative GTPase activating protein of Rab-like GTPase [Trypanosoma rangeli]RNE99823.1 putative GTPase activating protein of Rab-like GTPase [Trypanosoma rangeli]|eukprot:RNE99823.1 putative GTPase activating protein of Rab-like GTPase [Trypanosoma rangeli]